MFVDFNKTFKRDKNGELTTDRSVEFETVINAELLKKLLGEPNGKEFTMQYSCTETIFCYIPVRKHRKKRIQKKWAKRYGFVQQQVGERQVEKVIENVRLFTHGEFTKE